jgi:hypothetical protein
VNKLQTGVYFVTNKAACAAQRMGWSALYLSAVWLGSAVVGTYARLFFKREP